MSGWGRDYGLASRKKRWPMGSVMVIWFCPPLVVIGSVEFTQFTEPRSGLSCNTQPMADAGHAMLSGLGSRFAIVKTGTKFAMSERVAVAVKA